MVAVDRAYTNAASLVPEHNEQQIIQAFKAVALVKLTLKAGEMLNLSLVMVIQCSQFIYSIQFSLFIYCKFKTNVVSGHCTKNK